VILLDLKTGKFYSLTDSASFAFLALREGAALPEIVARMAEYFGEPPAKMESDFQAFMGDLIGKALCCEF